ncbi:alcohol oxidase [Mucidula mucida]|nr:alcohol oxidase [Mucidula mucida]
MHRSNAIALCLAGFVAPTLGVVYTNIADIKGLDAYDFVIVGAGPGGSTVANRLTEDASNSVLLVEAGGANDGDITVDVPLLCTRLTPNTPYDWNYTTIPQAGLNNRVVPFPTGFGLGGSTSVNCLVYTRGSSADIDTWAEMTGDEGWSWANMLPYFMKSEKFNLPRDGHDPTGQYLPEFHGTEGVIGVSLPGFSRAIDDRIMNTTSELAEFPYAIDMNSGEQLGVGWVQALVDTGARSSAKAHLTGPAAARSNLDILLHTKVARVVQTGATEDGVLSFRGVEVLDTTDGSFKTLQAKKEVILSAGSVNTPNILMHSGIGESALLSSLGIDVLVDLPSVGKNLTDHVGVSSTFIVNSTKTWDTIIRNETLLNGWLEEWQESRTGILVDTSENHAAWLRLPDNATIWETHADPSSGNLTAHYEFLFQNGLNSVTESGNYLNLPTACVSPTSRGFVSINSSDPFAIPLVSPNLLNEEIDLLIVREAIKSARRFMAAPAWDGYVLGSLNNNATTDEEIDEFVRNNAVSFFHPVSTSSMSPKGAQYGVVDPDLLVKGVEGLRIVDASVIPRLPAAHTSGPVYAMAERAADIIKAAYAAS